jgi:hypothetical protein
LASYGDEPEVSDRSAIGLGIAINDDDPLSAPRRSQGYRQTDNPCSNHC